MTWTDLNLLKLSPNLEDRVVCAITDASIDEVFDVTLVEIINAEFDWITHEQVMKMIRAAARAAIAEVTKD